MTEEIFLGRTEEQEKFRQVLQSYQPGWIQRNLPILKPFIKPYENFSDLPFLLLFYGEGGMGKTTLLKRLYWIVTEDKPFKDQFQVLFLDWEKEQKQTSDLQCGHDYIAPEALLKVLHKAMVEQEWSSYFKHYSQLVQDIKEIEAKVEKELRSPPIDLPKEISNLSASGLAWLIRSSTGQQIPTETITRTINVGAEGLYQARKFLEKRLKPQEFDRYSQPSQRLAESLGHGLAELAKRQPVVIFLDTFEIVDRPECDYTLRTVIRSGGERVLWAIAGRSNLADSGGRGKEYFRGYRADFPEKLIYAKSMSEFSVQDIRDYFQNLVSDRPITEAQATELARFSLGIPFVIREAAAMWREGAEMSTIIEPVTAQLGQTTTHQVVINKTSERFLVHCFSAKERQQDLQAVYALGMMRRPDIDLLKAMLDCEDLEQTLQELRERYSFIWVEQVRLAEKLASFVREYLLQEIRRTTPMVQNITQRAITWLELALEQQSRSITDTGERLEDERVAEGIISLAYYRFWQGEEAGWRYLVPRFVEGWQ